MSSKLSLFTTLFLILGPIYQKVRHLLGARPRMAPFGHPPVHFSAARPGGRHAHRGEDRSEG